MSGVFVGAIGALLLIMSNSHSAAPEHDGNVLGDILCIFAEICFASYFVFFKGLISRYSAVALMKWMFTYSAICVIPFSYSDFMTFEWGNLNGDVMLAICFVVVCATFFCYVLMPVAQKHLRPTVTSMYCYVQPVVASCVVAFYWGTSYFNLTKIVAIVLVFAGVFLVTRSKGRAQMEAYKKNIQNNKLH